MALPAVPLVQPPDHAVLLERLPAVATVSPRRGRKYTQAEPRDGCTATATNPVACGQDGCRDARQRPVQHPRLHRRAMEAVLAAPPRSVHQVLRSPSGACCAALRVMRLVLWVPGCTGPVHAGWLHGVPARTALDCVPFGKHATLTRPQSHARRACVCDAAC
jgi:hypothetical protein